MTDFNLLGNAAVKAKYELAMLSENKKNDALLAAAEALINCKDAIIEANSKDVSRAIENHMKEGLVDRLKLNEARIEAMADGLRQIALLPDPIGEVIESFDRPNGLHIEKVRVPMGVIGIIFEARPNVAADAFGLTFKSGNAVILKGGSDAINSNIAICNCIRASLDKSGINKDALLLIEDTDRAVTTEFMKQNRFVDLLIPRGGAGLIRSVVENSTIPVIETGTGNCHVYVDASADMEMAINILINAKTQRIGVCNACESLLVHKDALDSFLPLMKEALKAKNVEMRADEVIHGILPEDTLLASDEDYGTEYLDYIISMKTVNSVEEAVNHINKYNTKHSECIVTKDADSAEYFLNNVDAACVYVNASTRFTDGFEFGFGAEIGISTQKLHARGPMGLRELTSYKYKVRGNGQIR